MSTIEIRHIEGAHYPWLVEVSGYCQGESKSFASILDRASEIVAGVDPRVVAQGPVMIDAPCGCPNCDVSVQQGHFACECPPDWALELERAGKIARHYGDSGWRWTVAAEPRLPSPIAAVAASVASGRRVTFSCATDADLARALAVAHDYGEITLDRAHRRGYIVVAPNWSPQEVADYLGSL